MALPKGFRMSLETRRQMSRSAKKYCNKSGVSKKKSELMKEVSLRPEYKKKMSRSIKSSWKDPEVRRRRVAGLKKACNTASYLRMRCRLAKKIQGTPEARKRTSVRMRKLYKDPVYAAKHRKIVLIANQDPKRNRKISRSTKLSWKDPKIRAARLAGLARTLPATAVKLAKIRSKHPNKPEARMMEILSKLDLPFEFQKPMYGFLPDFVLENERLVIECNSRYWHAPIKVRLRDRRKKYRLENAGYKVVAFDEKRIKKSPELIARKITQILKEVA